MSKQGRGGANLRVVAPQEDDRLLRAQRLRAFREALQKTLGPEWTQKKVADDSVAVSARLGGGEYAAFLRETYNNMEAGRAQVTLYGTRVVVAQIYGITPEELSRLLEGKIEPEALASLRAARGPYPGGATDPESWRGRENTFADAPNWPELVQEARRIAGAGLSPVELEDETFEELGKLPWVYGPPSSIDPTTVAQWAVAIQATRTRKRSGSK